MLAEDFGWTEPTVAAPAVAPPPVETAEERAPAAHGAAEIVFAAFFVLVEVAWLALLAYLLVRYEVFGLLVGR